MNLSISIRSCVERVLNNSICASAINNLWSADNYIIATKALFTGMLQEHLKSLWKYITPLQKDSFVTVMYCDTTSTPLILRFVRWEMYKVNCTIFTVLKLAFILMLLLRFFLFKYSPNRFRTSLPQHQWSYTFELLGYELSFITTFWWCKSERAQPCFCSREIPSWHNWWTRFLLILFKNVFFHVGNRMLFNLFSG